MLQFESYEEHEKHLPSVGKFIIAQFDKESIVVYQGFKDSIAEHAVSNNSFGGGDYDFKRVTWLKPSFLWMMHYSGWAKKEDQENILAIRIRRKGFDEILRYACTAGQDAHQKNPVQLKWEIYHDLQGNKTDRKAAKIGLSNDILQKFNTEWILDIQNITPYVKEQQSLVLSNHISKVQLPKERAYAPDDLAILKRIDATTISL